LPDSNPVDCVSTQNGQMLLIGALALFVLRLIGEAAKARQM
jgi:hypothetical protein